jgi:phosphatidylglycerol:prolipoprotein diacylglycerol transferase
MNYLKAKYAGVLLFLVLLVYFLRQVFSGALILPQTFSIGPLTIHYYGVIMALAVAAAFYFAIKRSEQYGINPRLAEDLLFWLIIGGFIGARLYHVASSFGYYYIHPIDILKVWNGGLSIYGALIGGLITLWIYKKLSTFWKSTEALAKERSLQLLTLLDWLAPSLVLGQIIGRFGNFFNYEAFGYPTNLPWKMFVPFRFRPITYQSFSFFHPFFLYEVLGNLVILFFLAKIEKFLSVKGKPYSAKASAVAKAMADKSPGKLFFSYLLLYNSLRFCLEFLRVDSTFIGVFRLNAIVSLVLVLIAACILLLY